MILDKARFVTLLLFLSGAPVPGFGQSTGHDRRELDERFWGSVPDGTVARSCDPDSVELQVATNALEDLHARITELEAGDPHEPVAEALLELLKTPCFLLAMEVDRLPRPDSAESLIRWWDDGGAGWLDSYVELPEWTTNDVSYPKIVIPPDDRPTLSRSDRRHLYGPLLCVDGDDACARETAGWRMRAEEAIENTPENVRLEALSAGHWSWGTEDPQDVLDDAVRRACGDGGDRRLRYREFRECAGRLVRRRPVLPLGAIRAPSSGWLIVAGRRGHYDFCDGVSAYNLANGDGFRARRCSGLVLERRGSVDFDETDRRARDEVLVGSVDVTNLREAAWFLLILPEVAHLRAGAAYVDLPAGVEREIKKGERPDASVFGGVRGSTAQTTLQWSISDADFGTDGELVWPMSYEPEENHAVQLFRIAEAGWRDGCPSAPPSASELGRLFPGVNAHDADDDTFSSTLERLKEEIASWTPERCSDGAERKR